MFLLRWFGFLFDLLLLPLRLLRRTSPRGALLTVTIDGPVVDLRGRPKFWQRRAQKALSLHALDEVVTAMVGDDRVRGLLVTIRSLSAGMASASSLRALLARARAGGKEVVVHLPMGAGTKEVHVASVATKVLLAPTAQLAPLGFRSASPYVKRALDRAGIEPQVFACGEFKSAGENLVRETMSPAQRAQLERLFDTFEDALLEGIASGRGKTRDEARRIVDEAPYFGVAAIAAGLADDVAYEDEVPGKIGVERDLMVDAGAYLARVKRPLLRALRRPQVLAVVPVHGTIAHAAGMFGELSTDERVTRMVRAVRRDKRVRGVILHIDSPGGSALASDVMHHEIAQLAREKPVVACMANVAASGGYYVAAPAAAIIAEATTITGSIGVVAARMSIEPLLARLGINTEIVERGARASLLSATGPLDDDARAAVARELDATYRAFIGVVARGRSLPEEEVERLARGRVYTGKDALEAKLVDALGGFPAAVAELRKRVGKSLEVTMVKSPRNAIPPLDPPKAAAQALASLLPARERMLLSLLAGGERVLAIGSVLES